MSLPAREYRRPEGFRAVTLTEIIGRTPLIRLASLSGEFPNVSIFGKAELYNPGGSVKDRPAFRMILEGERSGDLLPGKTILDATSGNTGIAYWWIGAANGYPVCLVVPANISAERKRGVEAFGAEVITTDPMSGMDGAIAKARELYAGDPDRYFYPDQYNRPRDSLCVRRTGQLVSRSREAVTHGIFKRPRDIRPDSGGSEYQNPNRRRVRNGPPTGSRGGTSRRSILWRERRRLSPGRRPDSTPQGGVHRNRSL